MMARKPSHFGSNHQPRSVGSGPGLASIGSGSRTRLRVMLFRWREREGLGRDRDRVAVAPMLDDRCAVADANESGASVSVHHGPFRLKGAGRAELQLQEFRACDGVQTKRVHSGPGSAALSGVLLAASLPRTSVRDAQFESRRLGLGVADLR